MITRPSPSMAVSLLSLVIALGGAGYAATGGNFILGMSNTATNLSALRADISGPAVRSVNLSTASGATAHAMIVASGHAPFAVNSSTKVSNLNADKLDGLDSAAFVPAAQEGWHIVGAPG